MTGQHLGDRVRYHRRRTGRSQVVLAGLCGITDRYLSLIENGRAEPSLGVLDALAAELGVPITALLGDRNGPGAPAAPASVSAAVAQALMGHGRPRSAVPVTPTVLRDRVEEAWRMWQQGEARFTWAAAELPGLVAETEHAVRAHRTAAPTARREILRASADLYGLLRSYCRRSGRLDLSILAADRAVRAAEDADDPIRMAAAQWNLSHVLLSQPDAAPEAAAVAEDALVLLANQPEDSEQQALTGALHLVQGIAAAQQRRWWAAREHVDVALVLAERIGDGNVHRTVFGPTNASLHRLSIEMLAGQSSDALRVADRTSIEALPSRERRFTFQLDVARCYDLRRDDAAVLVHLLALEELSEEDFLRTPAAVDMLVALHRRVRPTYRPQVTALLARLHLES